MITPAYLLQLTYIRHLAPDQVSGDGIQTPKLLIVIGGDASTLEWVRDGLDDKDPATLTAVPVLVILPSAPGRPQSPPRSLAHPCALPLPVLHVLRSPP